MNEISAAGYVSESVISFLMTDLMTWALSWGELQEMMNVSLLS